MSKVEYFTYRTIVPGDLKRCIIVPKDYDNFPFSVDGGGSYNLAPARLIGLDYPTYLRFVRDLFPEIVTLEGKGKPYAYPVWCFSNELMQFIKFLNAKMNLEIKKIQGRELAAKATEEESSQN